VENNRVGCGYAIPAAWLLAIYPNLKFLACDPQEERARLPPGPGKRRVCRGPGPASGKRRSRCGSPSGCLHYFSDSDLRELLGRIRSSLSVEEGWSSA
jgi:hypothetical protein